MALTFDTVRALVNLEYQLLEADAALSALAEAVARLPLPGARRESRRLERMSAGVRAILARIDGPVSDATWEYERQFDCLPFQS